MVFPLDVVEPPPDAEKGLIGREVMFRFGRVDESDGVQKLDAI